MEKLYLLCEFAVFANGCLFVLEAEVFRDLEHLGEVLAFVPGKNQVARSIFHNTHLWGIGVFVAAVAIAEYLTTRHNPQAEYIAEVGGLSLRGFGCFGSR